MLWQNYTTADQRGKFLVEELEPKEESNKVMDFFKAKRIALPGNVIKVNPDLLIGDYLINFHRGLHLRPSTSLMIAELRLREIQTYLMYESLGWNGNGSPAFNLLSLGLEQGMALRIYYNLERCTSRDLALRSVVAVSDYLNGYDGNETIRLPF